MKINEDLNITIKDYIGNMEGGVTSIISIIYEGEFYEGVYWYTNEIQVITFPEELEDALLSKVENYEHYEEIKEALRKEEANFDSIIDSLDSVN